MEQCANCGREIGNLETHFIWNDNVVCERCKIALDPFPLDQLANAIKSRRLPVKVPSKKRKLRLLFLIQGVVLVGVLSYLGWGIVSAANEREAEKQALVDSLKSDPLLGKFFTNANGLAKIPPEISDLSYSVVNETGHSFEAGFYNNFKFTNRSSGPLTIYAVRYNGSFVAMNMKKGSYFEITTDPIVLPVGGSGECAYKHYPGNFPGTHLEQEMIWMDIWTDKGAFKLGSGIFPESISEVQPPFPAQPSSSQAGN